MKAVVNRASLKNCHPERSARWNHSDRCFCGRASAESKSRRIRGVRAERRDPERAQRVERKPAVVLLKHLQAPLTRQLMKPQELNQHNQNAEAKVEILGGCPRQDHRYSDSVPAQCQQQRPLPLQDEIRDWNVESGDPETKTQAGDFEAHIDIVIGDVSTPSYSESLNSERDPWPTQGGPTRHFSRARIQSGLSPH